MQPKRINYSSFTAETLFDAKLAGCLSFGGGGDRRRSLVPSFVGAEERKP
jgi:hypothetical protein